MCRRIDSRRFLARTPLVAHALRAIELVAVDIASTVASVETTTFRKQEIVSARRVDPASNWVRYDAIWGMDVFGGHSRDGYGKSRQNPPSLSWVRRSGG